MLGRRLLTIPLQQAEAVWEEKKRPEHSCSSCPSSCHSFRLLLLLLVHPSQMKPVPYTVHKKYIYIILLFDNEMLINKKSIIDSFCAIYLYEKGRRRTCYISIFISVSHKERKTKVCSTVGSHYLKYDNW